MPGKLAEIRCRQRALAAGTRAGVQPGAGHCRGKHNNGVEGVDGLWHGVSKWAIFLCNGARMHAQVLSWIDICAGLAAKTVARGPVVTAR
jgi:hypothetical protein